MSSIMGKSEIPTESRSKMFLRSNSFQKLCSLAHPMRLRGFKSNKEALKSVFESLIITTRGVIQSVTYRVLCFLFLTPFTQLLNRTLAVVSGEHGGRFSTVRLILKLTLSLIISTDKAEVKCDNEPEASSEQDPVDPCSSATCVDTAVQTETPQEECEEQQQQFFDCKDDFAVRPSAQELCSRFLENSRPYAPTAAVQRQPLSLNLIVYGCVLCCFGQLSALAYMLNVASTVPPGLIFLIAALGYIGYVMMRIFFDEYSSNRTDLSKPTDADTNNTKTLAVVAAVQGPKTRLPPKGIHPILAVVGKRLAAAIMHSKLPLTAAPASAGASPRMSRPALTGPNRTAMFCANNKTISKIKML